MKRKLIYSSLVCAVFALSRMYSAQTHESVTLFGPTGSQLLEICSEPAIRVGDVVPVERLIKGSRNNGLCAGYIAGINDSEMSHVTSGKGRSYCSPPEVQIDQLAKVVQKYLADNPAQLHLPGSVLVVRALEQSFPCH